MNKHLLIVLSTVLSSASCTISHAQVSSEDPIELRNTRAAYQQQLKVATDPIKVKYAQLLETLKKTLGAKGDVQGALAVQKEIESLDLPQLSPVGSRDDAKLIIWNQNNGGKGDRGSVKANIVLSSGDKEIWRRNGVRLSWDRDKDEKEVFAVPSASVDTIRIEIVESVNDRGGLAEVEFIKDGRNIALGCSVTASAFWENNQAHAPNKLTDGDPKQFWLLPDRQKGWAQINLKDRK